jgi:hypothetical protein
MNDENKKTFRIIGGTMMGVAMAYALMTPYKIIKDSFNPIQVYVTDVNNDGKPDVIMRNGWDKKFIFIQQNDGTYKELKETKNQEENSIEEKVKKIYKAKIADTNQFKKETSKSNTFIEDYMKSGPIDIMK